MAPARLAIARVTAWCSLPAGASAEAPAGPGEKKTASAASSAPSITRATFDTYTGLPWAMPTTTRPTSSELRNSGPTSTRSSRLSRTAVPAPCRTAAACSDPVSCIQLTLAAAMRSGSGSTRTTRGWPPINWARLASGTSETSCASSAASGRSRSLVQPLPQSVRLRNGTSSIECNSIIGGIVPCGMIEPIAVWRSWILTRLFSFDSFTLKRTVTIAMPGRDTE